MHIQPLSLSITFANFIEVVAGMGASLCVVLFFFAGSSFQCPWVSLVAVLGSSCPTACGILVP